MGRSLKLDHVILYPQGWKERVGGWTSTGEVAREEAWGSQAQGRGSRLSHLWLRRDTWLLTLFGYNC